MEVDIIPKDKTATYLKLVSCMKKEFLEKGYEKASLNYIAKVAGITPAGVYRHFSSKDAMFESLVQPVLDEFEKICSSSMDETLQHLDDEKFLKNYNPFEEGWADWLIDFMYDNFDVFKLLIVCSQGTKYEKFEDYLVALEENSTKDFLKELDYRGIPHERVSDEEWHIISRTYVTAVCEVIRHEYPREKAHSYMHFIGRFFYPGWKELLGVKGKSK